MTDNNVINVPAIRLEAARAKIAKLQKKAARFGGSDIVMTEGEAFEAEVFDRDGEKVKVKFVPVTIEGDTVKYGDYSLLARVEMNENRNLIHMVPGVEVKLDESFRSCAPYCDHCNTTRYRKDLFVFEDADGNQMTVGRNCLADFIGQDAKNIVARTALYEAFNGLEDDEDLRLFSGGEPAYNLRSVLAVAHMMIEKAGFTSKSKALESGTLSTADAVGLFFAEGRVYNEKEGYEKADAVRAWFEENGPYANDYMENTRIVLSDGVVFKKHFGLAVASVSTYNRSIAKAAANAVSAAESAYVGAVKDRLRGLEVIVEKTIALGDYGYGMSYLHNLKDAEGNVFIWKTGNNEFSEGETITIDGTVKEHNEYKGIAQTVLTRCKVK